MPGTVSPSVAVGSGAPAPFRLAQRLRSGRLGFASPKRVPPHGMILSDANRRQLAGWAADCAERALGLFETKTPSDLRPHEAIEGAGSTPAEGRGRPACGPRPGPPTPRRARSTTRLLLPLALRASRRRSHTSTPSRLPIRQITSSGQPHTRRSPRSDRTGEIRGRPTRRSSGPSRMPRPSPGTSSGGGRRATLVADNWTASSANSMTASEVRPDQRPQRPFCP